MRFWWVNHKQTFNEEIKGGYIWSPKTNSAGHRKVTYENLTKAKPFDVVFSYADKHIQGIGVVRDVFEELEKPSEFGKAGKNWDHIGWCVPIEWTLLENPIKPKDYFEDIKQLLPNEHSPLTKHGGGNQNCYLAHIDKNLGEYILSIIKDEEEAKLILNNIEKRLLEENEVSIIEMKPLHKTEKEQLIMARVGQGQYRLNLEKIEKKCRFTGVDDKRFLIASHIKPWRVSNNDERLDGNNGFLLSPHADKLFDNGYISIDQKGNVLTINHQIKSLMKTWGLDARKNIGMLNGHQLDYLDYHEHEIFYPLKDSFYK